MTNLRQAAEMALEALKTFEKISSHEHLHIYETITIPEAVKALRQALDQLPDTTEMIDPISEFECPRCGHCCRQVEEPLVTNAEPVAWMSDSKTKGNGKQLHWTKAQAWKWTSNITPLYAAPLKREWVGLTDHERRGIKRVVEIPDFMDDLIPMIEAKLREKNT